MEIKENGKGFTVSINGYEIIRHTIENPWIYLGHGKATYNMHLGNFYIDGETDTRIPLRDFSISRNDKTVEVVFSHCNYCSLKAVFYEENRRMAIEFDTYDKYCNRMWIRFPSYADECIYGCGEQYSHLNLKGKKFPLWVSEQGVGRNKKTYTTFMADTAEGAGGDYYTTYFPQPTFISGIRYFCHIEDSSYMEFNFKNIDYSELEIWNIPQRIVIGREDSFPALVKNLTGLVGRQPNLPDWVYNGVWLGLQGGSGTVFNKLENALDKGLKVSAVWAQDWEGKRITYFGRRLMWNWQWDEKLYPGLDEQIRRLKEKGIRFLGYINPYLAVEGNLFAEARDNNYLVKKRDGSNYLIDAGAFMVGMVDLTNPDGFLWYKGIIRKNMIDLGLSGWMADFGEYLPADAVLHNGVSSELMHNLWPVLWARCNREAVEEAGRLGDIVFFMRSGYSCTQRYSTLMWAGDQNVDWSADDGLPSVITSALSMGLSGFGLCHSDIGGYTTLFGMKRSKELFMRWAEMAAFMAVMRTHEGNRPDDNWQFDSDDETLLHFARMSRVYCKLAPYTSELARENSLHGIPVVRPLFLHYEDDKKLYDIQSEYMFGPDVLVSPVTEEGKSTWNVCLPDDKWVHLWSGREYGYGEHLVEAPVGYIPVFYRKHSPYAGVFREVGRL